MISASVGPLGITSQLRHVHTNALKCALYQTTLNQFTFAPFTLWLLEVKLIMDYENLYHVGV